MKKTLSILAVCFLMLSFSPETKTKTKINLVNSSFGPDCEWPIVYPMSSFQIACAKKAEKKIYEFPIPVAFLTPAEYQVLWNFNYIQCVCGY